MGKTSDRLPCDKQNLKMAARCKARGSAGTGLPGDTRQICYPPDVQGRRPGPTRSSEAFPPESPQGDRHGESTEQTNRGHSFFCWHCVTNWGVACNTGGAIHSNGKRMRTMPPTTLSDLQLTTAKLDAQLRSRKAPIAEPLPIYNSVISKWAGVAAVLILVGGLACLQTAKWIDPAVRFSDDAPSTASVLFVSGLVAIIVSLSMVLFAVIVLCCGLWSETHLREIKQGVYLARWTCTAEEWQTYIDNETLDLQRWPFGSAVFFSLVGLVVGFISVCGWPLDAPTSTVYTVSVGIFLGFMATGWALGTIVKLLLQKSLDARRVTPEAPIIGLTGFYFNRQFHAYKMPGRCLNTLKFRRKGRLYLFEFQFKQRIKNGDCYIDVRIPIPAEKLVEAKRVYWMIKKTAGLEA